MRNKRTFAFAALLITMICYLAVLFLIVGRFTGTAAVGVIFTLAALSLNFAIASVYIQEPKVEFYFFMFPAIYVGVFYLLLQMVLSLILAAMATPLRLALILEFVLLGVFGSVSCYLIYGGLRARDVQTRMKEKRADMRLLTKEATALLGCTSDYEWKRLIQRVIDDLNYARPLSEETFLPAQHQIRQELELMRTAVLNQDRQGFDQSAATIRRCLSDRG